MRVRGHNSYAVPTEVGKVGTESPTFIEPVQKRKDGIEAMFTRQAKAAAGSGKRKREPSPSPAKEEEEVKEMMGTSVSTAAPPLSPSKRSKAKSHPIKHEEDTADSKEEEGNSDVEILLLSDPSSPQTQSVCHYSGFYYA
jgi:hypothetical protein